MLELVLTALSGIECELTKISGLLLERIPLIGKSPA